MFYERTFLNRSFAMLFVLTMFFTSAAIATADSPAELLETAIYVEETVGDLDKAIEGYREVLSANDSSIEAAAEAQYRIGACLKRQGKTKDANEAFQKVAGNYPAAKTWVDQANEQLSVLNKLLPIPWGDGDEMHMHMKLPGGMDAGCQVFRVAKAKVDGKDCWECQNWQTVTLQRMGGKSRVVADFESFAPIESEWKHSMLGTAAAKFSDDEVELTMVGKDDVKTLKLNGPTYDNEQAAQVFRRLPLAEGYEGTLNIVTTLGRGLVPIELKCSAVETIEVPAGKFECFKLELSVLNQTFWISTGEKREIVRFEGSGVEADLVEVRQANAKPKTIGDDRYSLTLPLGWHAYLPDDSGDFAFLIDPDNSLGTEMKIETSEDAKKKFDSPDGRLKDYVSDAKKQLKNVSDEASEIKKIIVGGHPAAIVEYLYDGSNKKRVYRQNVVVYGNKSAVGFEFNCPAENLDSQRAKIEQILERLKLE